MYQVSSGLSARCARQQEVPRYPEPARYGRSAPLSRKSRTRYAARWMQNTETCNCAMTIGMMAVLHVLKWVALHTFRSSRPATASPANNGQRKDSRLTSACVNLYTAFSSNVAVIRPPTGFNGGDLCSSYNSSPRPGTAPARHHPTTRNCAASASANQGAPH